MSTATLAILEQATQLPEAECEELYQMLGDHLHRAHGQEDLTEELKGTLDRRWEEIVSGKVKCRDAFEVLDELRAKYNV